MAYRRARPKRRLSRTERIDNLQNALPAKDGPTMGDLISQRCESQADVNRVVSWLAKLMRPDVPEAAGVCCAMHAARRLHEWDKAHKRDEAADPDLDDFEKQHRCDP